MAVLAKKPAVDLAIIMGPKKGPMGRRGDEDEGEEDEPPESSPGERKPAGDDEAEELPAGFEEAFSEAFPDAAGDMDRMQAVKRLIHLCAGSY